MSSESACILTGTVRGDAWRVAIVPAPPFHLAAYDDRTLWVPAVLGLWSPHHQRLLVQPSMSWWSLSQGDSVLLELLSDLVVEELRVGLLCVETAPPGYATLGSRGARFQAYRTSNEPSI